MTNQTLTATVLNENTCEYSVVGKILNRMVQIEGMKNTAGEVEIYKVLFSGTYSNGSVRADVFVQRSNGSFAILNNNNHISRISRVMRVAKEIGATADYLAANTAI